MPVSIAFSFDEFHRHTVNPRISPLGAYFFGFLHGGIFKGGFKHFLGSWSYSN